MNEETKSEATDRQLETAESINEKLLTSTKFLTWLCIILFFLLLGSLIRSFIIQDQGCLPDPAVADLSMSIDRVDESTEDVQNIGS